MQCGWARSQARGGGGVMDVVEGGQWGWKDGWGFRAETAAIPWLGIVSRSVLGVSLPG